MKERYIKSLLLTIFFIMSCQTMVLASWQEQEEHWAYHEMKTFLQSETFLWQESGDWQLDDVLSTGELATIVNHLWQKDKADSLEENFLLLQQKGFLQEKDSTDEAVSREEVAVITCQMLALEYKQEATTSFLDDKEIDKWAKGCVATLQKKKIVLGYPNEEFRPNQNITKAEFITMMNRCKALYGQELTTEDSGDVSYLEIGVMNYEDEKVIISAIEDALRLQSGDVVQLSISLPEDAVESDVFYELDGENIVDFDDDFYTITALNEGTVQITFYTENRKYESTLTIIVEPFS